jgi:DNA-binding transcriptional LysR family regulator
MEALALLSTTLQRLRVFVTVVEHQGYSAAADHLGMAQPSVSYHVRALERALGAGLLIYKDRAIHLTPEGELVFRTARTILNEG